MMSGREIMATWRDLLDSVNYETLLPKFPEHATDCVRRLATAARERSDHDANYEAIANEFEGNDSPELIFFSALKQTAKCEPFSTTAEFMPYMPPLEAALDAQRRCRVCGCTDYNACICGCEWVAGDLCSECAAVLKGGNEDGKHSGS